MEDDVDLGVLQSESVGSDGLDRDYNPNFWVTSREVFVHGMVEVLPKLFESGYIGCGSPESIECLV